MTFSLIKRLKFAPSDEPTKASAAQLRPSFSLIYPFFANRSVAMVVPMAEQSLLVPSAM